MQRAAVAAVRASQLFCVTHTAAPLWRCVLSALQQPHTAAAAYQVCVAVKSRHIINHCQQPKQQRQQRRPRKQTTTASPRVSSTLPKPTLSPSFNPAGAAQTSTDVGPQKRRCAVPAAQGRRRHPEAPHRLRAADQVRFSSRSPCWRDDLQLLAMLLLLAPLHAPHLYSYVRTAAHLCKQTISPPCDHITPCTYTHTPHTHTPHTHTNTHTHWQVPRHRHHPHPAHGCVLWAARLPGRPDGGGGDVHQRRRARVRTPLL